MWASPANHSVEGGPGQRHKRLQVLPPLPVRMLRGGGQGGLGEKSCALAGASDTYPGKHAVLGTACRPLAMVCLVP